MGKLIFKYEINLFLELIKWKFIQRLIIQPINYFFHDERLHTVCLKKNAPLLFPQISHQWKKIFAPNFHYFVGNLVGNEMACSNLPGKFLWSWRWKVPEMVLFSIKIFPF